MRNATDSLTRAGISADTVRANLETLWDGASESVRVAGSEWYPLAYSVASELSDASGYSVDNCAAVISHLSPQTFWSVNVKRASALILSGEKLSGTMAREFGKANAALVADNPLSTFTGPKTTAFVRNILGDLLPVTIDGWQRKACGVTQAQLGRVGVYSALADIHTALASDLGIAPAEFQATTWIQLRGRSH